MNHLFIHPSLNNVLINHFERLIIFYYYIHINNKKWYEIQFKYELQIIEMNELLISKNEIKKKIKIFRNNIIKNI
jgi:hypothetical protein